MDEHFQVGDVIQLQGPSVPRDLWDKWFRVEDVDAGGAVRLSWPYLDEALTQRYHPPYPAHG